MKRTLFSLLIAAQFTLTSCGGKQITLPVLNEIRTETASGHREAADYKCSSVFPRGSWQFVHAIDFSLKSGGGSTVVGVTALTPDSLKCALVTPEGFTLFSGTLDREDNFEVKRAVPPFDKPAFAQGMLEDLQAIFREPIKARTQRGHLGDPPAAVCRYTDDANKMTDVFPEGNTDTCWQIRNYTANKKLTRSVIAQACKKTGPSHIPQKLELQTYGPTGYILKMNLISAEHLP
ncbi:hypothetical protein VT98_10365 [Candidatus Electrothrix communis]|uniref:Lipoprotein n=1 Tax=Candidatus Electrothrix communis TaxID=1859133 RepID=A0A444J8W3_9BACT|nr:hypothetical protein VT98_10365 [Candidatus Electrothrix communis]